MMEMLIYGALSLLLLGCLFGLAAANKGFMTKHGADAYSPDPEEKTNPAVKRFLIVWGKLVIVGFIFIGVGIYLN